jgi:hypothetical protein
VISYLLADGKIVREVPGEYRVHMIFRQRRVDPPTREAV